MPILFLTRMCITVAFIGGNGDDYYSITRALISDGSKLRAKNWCCSSSHYCGCGDMKWRSDIKSVRHKEWASAWESVSVCGFHLHTTTHTRAHTHLHLRSSKGRLFFHLFKRFQPCCDHFLSFTNSKWKNTNLRTNMWLFNEFVQIILW